VEKARLVGGEAFNLKRLRADGEAFNLKRLRAGR